MELTFLENALIQGIFSHAPPHLKLAVKYLSSRHALKETSHSPRQHSFKNLFPPTAERGLLYQNSVRKYEDDLNN